MFGEIIRFGFYWGVREESLDDCAMRAAKFLSGLATHIESLSTWFDSDDRDFGDGAVTLTVDGLDPILSAGAAFNDIGEPMPSLGFTLSLVNRLEGNCVHLELSCGGSCPWVPNVCVLRFLKTSAEYEKVLHPPLALSLSHWIIHCWEPDHGLVTCPGIDEAIPVDDDQIGAGWITYISRRTFPKRLSLDGTASVDDVDDLGQLVVLNVDRFSASCQSQHDVIKRVFYLINSLNS